MPWKLTDDEFRGLLPCIPAVGATNAMPGLFPEAFESAGINRRDSVRNTFLGVIVTHPEPDLAVFGAVFADSDDDGQHDEDVYALDQQSRTVTKYSPREWRRLFPQYEPFHHSDKSFLLE